MQESEIGEYADERPCNATQCVPLTFYTGEKPAGQSNDEANRRDGANLADNEALIIVGRYAHRQL